MDDYKILTNFDFKRSNMYSKNKSNICYNNYLKDTCLCEKNSNKFIDISLNMKKLLNSRNNYFVKFKTKNENNISLKLFPEIRLTGFISPQKPFQNRNKEKTIYGYKFKSSKRII